MSMKNQPFFKRMKYALEGIATAIHLESSFRLQCLATFLVVLVLAWSKPAMIWWALLLLNCGMVLAAELFNTALEQLSDHLHPALHPSIKIAKDCAAGAVLVLSLSAVGVFVAFLVETLAY
ncbi:diacylglycerol kinase (ATP) [Janthinobacterium sp. 35]|jgi:undecaprenol kinase|nr:diacylglycerol kinase [Janthinobacterium sp. 35]PIG28530.1 diacylglycerol kinase (ATP) [Janthinobacterium sp. 35]PVX38640.1 diacylglycerol kinase (ATP) [Janthinobacterium sp. 78]